MCKQTTAPVAILTLSSTGLASSPDPIQAPTRELALQVSEALENYASGIGRLRVLTVYGGAPIYRQLKALERGVHVVVGTPGRVMDCMERGKLDLGVVRSVVLDEADEMLRMGRTRIRGRPAVIRHSKKRNHGG